MIRVVKYAESVVGKRKLILCFAVIIMLAIGFLYYESFSNLNNRFRPFSPFSSENTVKISTTSSQIEEDRLSAKTDILKDNQNNENETKCWNIEKFKVIEECTRCDLFSLKFLNTCLETGYREVLDCKNYGHVSRSCPTPAHVLSKRYWSFEFICLIFCAIFSSFVRNRKKFLDDQAIERMRQQILS